VYQSVLHDVVRALENDAGLDSGVFSALAYLARAKPTGRMRLGDLQELMHPRYSQPGLSRLVQRMEADGLLERSADPGDRRAAILVTTRAGRARFARADAVYTDAVREHFGQHLAAAEARALEHSLETVLRARATSTSASRTVRPR
jgi:DNA-binding MarR family transcriptional regulator